jgi:hypothetical protein
MEAIMNKRSQRDLVDSLDQLQKLRERVETLREDQTERLYEIDGSLKKQFIGTEVEAIHEDFVSAVDAIDEAIGRLDQVRALGAE